MSRVLIVDCGSMGISYDLILKQEGSTTTKIGIKKQAFEAILELEQQLKEAKAQSLKNGKFICKQRQQLKVMLKYAEMYKNRLHGNRLIDMCFEIDKTKQTLKESK